MRTDGQCELTDPEFKSEEIFPKLLFSITKLADPGIRTLEDALEGALAERRWLFTEFKDVFTAEAAG